MTAAGPAILLLTSPLARTADVDGLRAALALVGPVTAPGWAIDRTAPDLLAAPAAEAGAALGRTSSPVVLCGVGSGAVLALRVAAEAGDRVAGLVLATGRRPSGPRPVLVLHRAAADLLPLAVLQRLHAPERLLLQTLDLVRPQDVRPLAARVPQPSRVAWGRRDPLDRWAAARLAAALPAGRLVPLDDAGPGWVARSPERLAGLVATRAPER
ncbi:hypothetical protein SAMN04488543_0407 [Friedmanniella luteola]|uniref:Alpha/beta hydrolase family protein n=1 Tax=Friedmanniella luteola TaxID=546871 RepID=A0A1H1LRP6_9ACTN|nr:hypothetical protein [Friedmanniella luteola]SDR77206.1 hypothetical protein SAMN04488543_0407 [Friedmanniella luteola]